MPPRTSKRAASSRASHKIESLLSPRMDPKLWGNLPREVLLEIYNALLIRDFYNLRVVCKDWNTLACERRCFDDLVRKPYFVLFSFPRAVEGAHYCPIGTLAFNTSSGRWIWKLYFTINCRWCHIGAVYEAFVVEGVLFDSTAVGKYRPSGLSIPLQNLLDPGTIPEIPQSKGSLLGMIVDTSTRPSTCKFIVGNCHAETLILDSQTNKWVPKPSSMVRCRAPSRSASPKSCVQCDGRMYIWSDSDEIQVYSLEEDKWTTLNAPPRDPSDEEFRGLGHWQSKLYAVTKNEHGTLSVWKLIDPPTQEWSEYERIPSDMFSYLLRPGAIRPIIVAHCNEFLLMHVLTRQSRSHMLRRRYVLFNISNRRWETVALPHSELLKYRFRS